MKELIKISSRSLINVTQKQPPVVLCKKRHSRNFTKYTGKGLCQSLSLRPATLLKKRLWRGCFPVNFVKFQRRPFSHNTFWRLLPVISNLVRKTVTVNIRKNQFYQIYRINFIKFIGTCFEQKTSCYYRDISLT